MYIGGKAIGTLHDSVTTGTWLAEKAHSISLRVFSYPSAAAHCQKEDPETTLDLSREGRFDDGSTNFHTYR